MTPMSKNKLEIITLNKPGITDFAKERNVLLKKAKSEWIFYVDSDEVVTPKLKEEIKESVKDKNINGYYVKRKDFFFGRELKHGEFSVVGGFGNAKLMRLGRRGKGYWHRAVHEYWRIEGKTATLKNSLLHYPHKDLTKFISNINYFSTLHAKALEKENKTSSILKIIIWPVGKFVYNFTVRLGFLDGMEGFVAAIIMSFHSYLSWSKQWLSQKN